MNGHYSHSLDAKGRISIPAKFREELGVSFIVTKGFDKCLAVYPMSELEALQEKINSLSIRKARQLQMFIVAPAQDCEADNHGRVLLSQELREYAGLEKNVVVVGMTKHAEIWDEDVWKNTLVTAEEALDILEGDGI